MLWPAFLDFLKAIWPSLVGAVKLLLAGMVARKITQGNAAENELDRLSEAAKARTDVELLSDADVVREVKKRGLYRDAEPATGRWLD